MTTQPTIGENKLNEFVEKSGKPRVFMSNLDFVGPYRQKRDEIAANDYEGFAFTEREGVSA